MQKTVLNQFAQLGSAVAMAAILTGCTANRAGPTTGRDLVGIDEAWAAAAAEGDMDAIMAFWTDDAVMYPEGHAPLYGKAEIRAFIKQRRSKPGYRMAWTPCCAGVDQCGAMAYTLGEGSATVIDDAGTKRELTGRYVAIWRKQNGQWRCAVKCWNSSPLAVSVGR